MDECGAWDVRSWCGVCERCMCLARGSEVGEWMRGLGLDFTNPVGTRGVLDVCLCFGCGGVGGEWVGGLDHGLDSLCRWQVQVYV